MQIQWFGHYEEPILELGHNMQTNKLYLLKYTPSTLKWSIEEASAVESSIVKPEQLIFTPKTINDTIK